MTCVVGLISGDEVWLGSDSAAVDENGSLQHVRSKVVRPSAPPVRQLLLGYTTSFRVGQLLQYHLALPTRTKRVDPERYVIQQLVPAIRETFRDGGWMKKDAERESGGDFLVGYAGRLFRVQSDFSVLEPTSGYEAIGSGRYEALGALFATGGMAARERVETALRAAECFNGTVRGPFVVEKL